MMVLDASALVCVLVDQPDAAWVIDRIAEDEVVAPAHQPAEVLSAMARLVRQGVLSADSAREAVDEALALSQRLVLPSPAHIRRAFALRERIRVVDALYVVLADELGCPLVTIDRRLAGADAPCEVRVPPAAADPIPGLRRE
ncbi:MAG: type II toxin-antitoxin system VapC family toxin [Pseudonocardia sp.]